MKRHIGITAVIFSVLAIGGCQRNLPLISHAHIGHSLTAWRDTPNQQGLFVIAEKETASARKHAAAAARSTPQEARRHLQGVVHALNPDAGPGPGGLGYGAIRALQGSLDHITYAAQTEDASDNIQRSAAVFERHGKSVLERLQVAFEVSQIAGQSSDTELPGLTSELEQLLGECIGGNDVNGNGVIDKTPAESGLVQLRKQLSEMVHDEKNPPYHPIGRRYLLGLIRLPNGRWDYQFDSDQPDGAGYSTY